MSKLIKKFSKENFFIKKFSKVFKFFFFLTKKKELLRLNKFEIIYKINKLHS